MHPSFLRLVTLHQIAHLGNLFTSVMPLLYLFTIQLVSRNLHCTIGDEVEQIHIGNVTSNEILHRFFQTILSNDAIVLLYSIPIAIGAQ
jgi:hypothetical protein